MLLALNMLGQWTVVEGDPKAPFSLAEGVGDTSFPELLHLPFFLWIDPFTHELNLTMLSVNQGGITYHFFFSLWYDSACKNFTPTSLSRN